MIDLIGKDINETIDLLKKNNYKYKIIKTKSIKNYNGYQYRVVRTKMINNNVIITIAKF